MTTEPWPYSDFITINGLWLPNAHGAEEAQWWTAVPKSLPGPQLGMWPRSLLRRFYVHRLPKRLRRTK